MVGRNVAVAVIGCRIAFQWQDIAGDEARNTLPTILNRNRDGEIHLPRIPGFKLKDKPDCYRIVGITKSAPERMPVGQRVVMVLSLV